VAVTPATPADPARWDGQAIREGASVAVLFAVPFTLIARLAFETIVNIQYLLQEFSPDLAATPAPSAEDTSTPTTAQVIRLPHTPRKGHRA